MVALYKDPEGKDVFRTSAHTTSDNQGQGIVLGEEFDITAAKATIDSLRKRIVELETISSTDPVS